MSKTIPVLIILFFCFSIFVYLDTQKVLSLVMCMLAISALYLMSATKSTDKHIKGSTVLEIGFLSSILAILPNLLVSSPPPFAFPLSPSTPFVFFLVFFFVLTCSFQILLFFYKAKTRYVDEVLDVSKDDFDYDEKETPKHEEEGEEKIPAHEKREKKDEGAERKKWWFAEVLCAQWPWWWGPVAYVLATFLILSCGYTTVMYLYLFSSLIFWEAADTTVNKDSSTPVHIHPLTQLEIYIYI
jgi:hypothetical protein